MGAREGRVVIIKVVRAEVVERWFPMDGEDAEPGERDPDILFADYDARQYVTSERYECAECGRVFRVLERALDHKCAPA